MNTIKIYRKNESITLPTKGSEGAVGWDLRAYIEDNKEIIIPPKEGVLIPTGLYFELPKGCEMDIKSRSSLFSKHGLICQGTVDPDYRGEVFVMLFNLSSKGYTINNGDRIAQAVFRQVFNNNDLFIEVSNLEELSNTQRGEGGFGSTGVK